ncbi:hypothetical protein EDC01DRAFT_787941 [Geopyxis carbonaria]|nr:hypothetical protein EDC01DRAFT_787941 [Geopyxis carbonaria]
MPHRQIDPFPFLPAELIDAILTPLLAVPRDALAFTATCRRLHILYTPVVYRTLFLARYDPPRTTAAVHWRAEFVARATTGLAGLVLAVADAVGSGLEWWESTTLRGHAAPALVAGDAAEGVRVCLLGTAEAAGAGPRLLPFTDYLGRLDGAAAVMMRKWVSRVVLADAERPGRGPRWGRRWFGGCGRLVGSQDERVEEVRIGWGAEGRFEAAPVGGGEGGWTAVGAVEARAEVRGGIGGWRGVVWERCELVEGAVVVTRWKGYVAPTANVMLGEVGHSRIKVFMLWSVPEDGPPLAGRRNRSTMYY